jgi:ankyrin repeat protein
MWKVVRELLNYCSNADFANNEGETSLNIASFKGHVNVVRELLNHGASVNIADN